MTPIHLALAALAILSMGASKPTPPHRIDPGTVPITATELTQGLRRSSHDADATLTYLRRAEVCEIGPAAFATMKTLKAEQPDNAVVLGGYCFAYTIAAHAYNSHRPKTARVEFSGRDHDEYARTLQKAIEVDPNCYIAPTIKGWTTAYSLTRVDPRATHAGLAMLASERARHPKNTWVLFNYGMTARYLAGVKPSPEAEEALSAALHLDPPMSEAALSLYSIYMTDSKAKAEAAKQTFLSLLDPGYVIPPETKELLGIK